MENKTYFKRLMGIGVVSILIIANERGDLIIHQTDPESVPAINLIDTETVSDHYHAHNEFNLTDKPNYSNDSTNYRDLSIADIP
jgi:hypothetical protein